MTGTLAVSGRDYRLAASFRFNDGTATVEHRYVDGKAWYRFNGGKWGRFTNFTAALSMSPFAFVKGVGDVRFVGAEKVGEVEWFGRHGFFFFVYFLGRFLSTR